MTPAPEGPIEASEFPRATGGYVGWTVDDDEPTEDTALMDFEFTASNARL
jgi:hypothetical protein